MILSQTDGTNTMYFQYDTNGTPLGFVLNGTQYFYITNQMNDVLAITDTTGTIVGNYEYDAWGTVTLADTEIAQQNPLRYRGYYYDSETGYYYLQSRYYYADICRFINADVPEISHITKDSAAGTNLFSYCNNNPINNTDTKGNLALVYKVIIAAVLGGLIGAISEAIIQYIFERKPVKKWNWRSIAIEFVSGAINGALIACHLRPKTVTIIKGITSAVTSISHNINKGNFKTPGKALMSIGAALLSCVSTMYITSVSENIKRILGKSVSQKTIREITKKVSLNRLRRAGIRFAVRIGKWTYDLIID